MASINPRGDSSQQQQQQQPPSRNVSREMGSQDSLELIPGNSLITATPEEGRQLAIQMARAVVSATQPDRNVQRRLREVYSMDAAMLIEITHVTAIEFQTIAAANNYWRHEKTN
jgi:Hexameric tyrosine-coordinated heme protein (HTHP).